jgi:hypothetical protein
MFDQRVDTLHKAQLQRLPDNPAFRRVRWDIATARNLSVNSLPMAVDLSEDARFYNRAVNDARAGSGVSTDYDLRALWRSLKRTSGDIRLLRSRVLKSQGRASASHGSMRCAPNQNMKHLARVTRMMDQKINQAVGDFFKFRTEYLI